MGKFDGMMICSDIDGTLIDDNFKIPQENLDAISYFKQEGGVFTLSTGRTPQGARIYIDAIEPNAPIVCQNGAGLYDFGADKYVWYSTLDDDAYQLIDFLEKEFPNCGIEVVCDDTIYFVKENGAAKKHRLDEGFSVIYAPYSETKKPWIKMLITEWPGAEDKIEQVLRQTEFAKRYRIVRSAPVYLEIIHTESNKGAAALRLGEIMGIAKDKIYTIGDNDNDREMLEMIQNSFAVKNASFLAKKTAARILSKTNNDGAIAELVRLCEKGI